MEQPLALFAVLPMVVVAQAARRHRFTVLAIISVIASAWLHVNAQTTAPAIVTAIRADRMLDVQSGKIISHAVVVVEADRITAAGTDIAIPPGARLLDLGNVTLLPGLIDSHTHLLQYYDRAWRADPAMTGKIRRMTTVNKVLLGAATARDYLDAGITTVRDLGSSGVNGDVALRDAIEDGWVIGPRMVVSTRPLVADDGKADPQAPDGPLWVKIRSPEDARQAVRQAVLSGADCIKIIVNGPPLMPLEVAQAIVEEAHRAGKKVAAHAVGEQATRIAAQAGVDSIEHAYAHFQQEFGVAALPDDVLKIMAEKHIFLVPTDATLAVVMDLRRNDPPQDRARVEEAMRKYGEADAARLRRAIQAGVPIAAGSDNDTYNSLSGKNRGQVSLNVLQAYAEAGMSPADIIRAATVNAAELLGLSDRVGSIREGKLADIIAVKGDPLKDITALETVAFVMKSGRVYKPMTAQ
jgi:imidazolonepropionase-like amidohydrolase